MARASAWGQAPEHQEKAVLSADGAEDADSTVRSAGRPDGLCFEFGLTARSSAGGSCSAAGLLHTVWRDSRGY